MPPRLLFHTCASPAEDLALEEAIQLGMEEGASVATWRIWRPAVPALILGTGQQVEREVDLEAARSEGVSVLRRHTGGGAVLIGPGTINYSGFFFFDALPGSETITGAMRAALAPVMRTLEGWGVAVHFVGLSDLAVVPAGGDGLRKLCGNSQARKRRSVLVHGTMLANPDWALLARLLKFPSRSPDYRAGRDHRAFLVSLKELGVPFECEAFHEALASNLGPDHEPAFGPEASEMVSAQVLAKEKYARDEWNFRR